MARSDKVIRLSQAVTSFGVGAIYDILRESFVLADTTWGEIKPRYNAVGREIPAQRLVNDLKGRGHAVDRLNEPVEMDDARSTRVGPPSRGLPYSRFPRWLFCSTCRRMTYWTFEMERDMGKNPKPPTCPSCGKKRKLTPMRFVVICDEGHMDDVPWSRWAHSNTQREDQKACRADQHLVFRSRAGHGGGFDSLVVECKTCGAFRSLEGLTRPNALAGIGVRCKGKQPWQTSSSAQTCARETYVVQRGAGNVYYPSVASAITIPPESDPDSEKGQDLRGQVREHTLAQYLLGKEPAQAMLDKFVPLIADDLGCGANEVTKALTDDEEPTPILLDGGIPSEEWKALIKPHQPSAPRAQFVNERVELLADGDNPEAVRALDELVDRVMAVRKLREVRALLGFFRYQPGGDEDDESRNRLVRPDLGQGKRWLPATEVFGEGIFITLNEKRLRDWEREPEVIARTELLEERRKNSLYSPILHKATPRYVLLHTLAHLLIRRLAFSCGYASASLRERIYASTPDEGEPRAGVLIYTAAGDAEGTLGGLVRQAEPPRLARNLIAALYDGTHCSSDPVCRESNGQGLEAMNLAACHACSLMAETSCESMNLLLDRVLVVGDDGTPGFFRHPLELALTAATN